MGANPIRPIGRSAGSNQSDEGGNEFVEVLCVKVTLGDRANRQAETRVNAERAPTRHVAEADLSRFWGRPLPLDKIATASNGSAGLVALACMEEEIDRNMGSPAVAARDRQSDSGDGQTGRRGVADRTASIKNSITREMLHQPTRSETVGRGTLGKLLWSYCCAQGHCPRRCATSVP